MSADDLCDRSSSSVAVVVVFVEGSHYLPFAITENYRRGRYLHAFGDDVTVRVVICDIFLSQGVRGMNIRAKIGLVRNGADGLCLVLLTPQG